MNKNAIQKFAIWARNDLIAQVSQRAYQYGIDESGFGDASADTLNGRLLTAEEKSQRQELIKQIKEKGYQQVMEEVAYTWFNRFIALRFMEVNGFLPSHIRVFSDASGAFKPEILNDVLHLDLPGLNSGKVAEYIESNDTEALYRYLLLTQCNALNSALPVMFERMGGYTEMLLPNNILRQDSILGHMVSDIPEEDWQDAVQIIGWLYQYYNTELKDDTFAQLKKNVKITKERIPAATQLFTPDWIVRYMVENSLGRLWLEGHPNAELRGGWKYYLDEAEQERSVEDQLAKLREEYKTIKPEDVKFLDPCMGSGHILVYAFDVLMQIYTSAGWDQREAAQSILKNNLYGLDIDDRAAQLAYFAVMMKARQYDRRIFSRGIQPHVYAIVESNGLDSSSVEYFTNNDSKRKKDFGTLMDELRDAKEYGSILNISQVDFAALYARVEEVRADISMFREIVLSSILPLIQVAEVMAQKYDVVVTNPPYMGNGSMGQKLSNYVKAAYPNSKSDLSTVFMEHTLKMCKQNGYMSMINIPVWMFLSSYEKLREDLLRNTTLQNMLHLGRGVFGSDFGTTAFVFSHSFTPNHRANYRRLFEKQGAVDSLSTKESWFFEQKGNFISVQDEFWKIPGAPFAYWLPENLLNAFSHKPINGIGAAKQGLATGDNGRFLRLWHEVNTFNVSYTAQSRQEAQESGKKWFPCNKGGSFRKWYGNNDFLVNWKNDGEEIRAFKDENGKLRSRPQNMDYYFREGITWSTLSIGQLSMRFSPKGHLFETKGSVLFFNSEEMLFYVLGLVNSVVIYELLQVLCPTVDFHEGPIGKIPVLISHDDMDLVIRMVHQNIEASRQDWDSYETSWDFKQSLLANGKSLTAAYAAWKQECEDRFQQLKKNEEELNRIFIDIYGLQDELTPDVSDKDVTVHRVFTSRDDVPESMKGSNYVRTMRDEIVSLISYAVGCMFGRYSLDKPGLVFAGYSKIEQTTKTLDGDDPELEKFAKQNADGSVSYGSYYHEVNQDNYRSFPIDTDNIIPICDDEYFDDDITGRFVEFVRKVYGDDTLEENLKFVADALGGKGTPREVIRSYFLNDFYADHLKTYQKRPIYWLFDSGKKNGFKALCYMHRYQRDLLARLRTDYVHEQQERYRTQLAQLGDAIDRASASERVKLTKQQKKFQDQATELQKYEEKVHHLADQNIEIDLDDGVKHNYELFADVLAKIK